MQAASPCSSPRHFSLAIRWPLLVCVLVAVFGSTASGCTHIQRLLGSLFEKPKLRFESAAVRDISLGGLTLDLTWLVENPNGVAVRIDNLAYAFDVEGRRLTSGVQPKGVDVAANGQSRVTLPFEVRFVDLADSVVTLLRNDQIRWNAEGSFGFDTPVGMLDLPFKREGTTELPRLPEVRLAGVRISNLSLTGVTMNVDLGLGNPNTFAVPIDQLRYSILVAGAEVAVGNTRPPRLAPSQEAAVSLPITVSFANTGRAVFDAIQSGSAEIGVRGGLSSGPIDLPLNLSQRVSLR